ncbi:MAG TPA: glycosyltransferase [Gammaproteobacteria bacterium]|nr:glycosyltransferase [Gammaproteobacteria bacterium]
MSEKKLTVFTSFSGQGGVERMVLNLVEAMAAQGAPIDLLALKADSDHLRDLPEGVNLIRLKARHSSTVVPELAAYLRQQRPAAMLVAKDRPGRAALRARRKAGVKTRIVIRLGTNLSAALEHKPAWRRWLRRWPLKRGYRDVDHIVAVSQGVAEDTARVAEIPVDKISVIRNPVITASMLQAAREPVEHRWFRDHGQPVILGAGRLTVQKDFETLIRAFARVREKHSARLIVLGEGGQRASLENLVEELGLTDAVDLPGFQRNPHAWMRAADLFVLSSRWEGSPNVLTEAIALGTPVVSTDCPSGPVELLQEGKFGPLVPVGDVEEMARAILLTLRHPLDSETLKSAAREYTAENSARRYLETLF